MARVGARVGHTRVTRGAHVVAFIKERKEKKGKGQGKERAGKEFSIKRVRVKRRQLEGGVAHIESLLCCLVMYN